jgi:hypothetical protein
MWSEMEEKWIGIHTWNWLEVIGLETTYSFLYLS